MALLADGSILAAVSNGPALFSSTSGSLIRLVDSDDDGVAEHQTVLVDDVPGGGLRRCALRVILHSRPGKESRLLFIVLAPVRPIN
jgi:hypothetical protein